MAATRKSDFTGDKFGDWEVVERAEADNGKRRWLVKNGDETMVVLQTELKDLVKRNDRGQRIHTDADPVYASDPTRNKLPADDDDDDDDGSAEDPVEIPKFDDEADALLVDAARAAYVPKGENAESAVIARAALGIGPDGLRPEEKEWARNLPVEEPAWVPDDTDVRLAELDPVKLAIEARQRRETKVLAEIELTADEIVKVTGIGENTPETVSEAGLDAAAAAIPQDPMRKAIRDVMGSTVDVRHAMARAEAAHVLMSQELTELQLAYERMVELIDQAMKVAVTR